MKNTYDKEHIPQHKIQNVNLLPYQETLTKSPTLYWLFLHMENDNMLIKMPEYCFDSIKQLCSGVTRDLSKSSFLSPSFLNKPKPKSS